MDKTINFVYVRKCIFRFVDLMAAQEIVPHEPKNSVNGICVYLQVINRENGIEVHY